MKILIIEDEPAAASRMKKLVLELLPEATLEGPLDSIESSVAYLLTQAPPDLILLDIQLADGASFAIFEQVTVTSPVIFTTAYDDYAIQAFKVNAVDYLLKPIKRPELEAALARYRDRTRPQPVDYTRLARAMREDEQQRRFLVRIGQQMRLLPAEEIAYAYTEHKITFAVARSGKRYPLDLTLEKLEERLDPAVFFRINRQFIVNVNAIEQMYAYSKSRVKLDLSPPCDLETVVSTERSPLFKKWLLGAEE